MRTGEPLRARTKSVAINYLNIQTAFNLYRRVTIGRQNFNHLGKIDKRLVPMKRSQSQADVLRKL
jgi:hypothetical protein